MVDANFYSRFSAEESEKIGKYERKKKKEKIDSLKRFKSFLNDLRNSGFINYSFEDESIHINFLNDFIILLKVSEHDSFFIELLPGNPVFENLELSIQDILEKNYDYEHIVVLIGYILGFFFPGQGRRIDNITKKYVSI